MFFFGELNKTILDLCIKIQKSNTLETISSIAAQFYNFYDNSKYYYNWLNKLNITSDIYNEIYKINHFYSRKLIFYALKMNNFESFPFVMLYVSSCPYNCEEIKIKNGNNVEYYLVRNAILGDKSHYSNTYDFEILLTLL